MWEKVKLLENHAHFLPVEIYIVFGVCYIYALKKNFSVSRSFKEIQRTQKRRFSASAGSDYDDNFAFFDFKIDSVKSLNLAFSKIFF